MINTTAKQKILIFSLIVGFLAIASTSFASWNCRGGYGPGSTYSSANLTTEQQQKLDVVKEKYSGQLDELQASLNSKTEEYRSASANDSTTVGALRNLETEIVDLEKQYWSLLDKANKEAGGFIAGGNGSWFRCGYNGCDHQSHRARMGQGHQMGSGHMSRMAGHMGGCWRN
ncbi:hypothetical protein SAMN02745165_02468 [Malonomonas rubra DSM 5091]|uniref:Zinc resistance-associated protein n=1 Tax=Malonomonas rubra DSM 5091 TaxID=1122189 RepID=A0A1M6JQ95_MALRU|nr:hypothetical protein [Malonomonas rubra]SHJ48753.1 hypothetical protein SAMN02745165_02468 [Malonomonas rubra DSM 5091]